MAANKRNAGLTSAIPRASLNDEELVRPSAVLVEVVVEVALIVLPLQSLHRKRTCTRRHCKRSSIPSRVQRRIISSPGRQPVPRTATSVRAFSGELHDKVSAVPSAESSATKSAETCSMPTACKVCSLLMFPEFGLTY